MKFYSMNRVGDAGRTERVLRIGSLLVALSAVACSGNLEEGVAESEEIGSTEQAFEPMCPPQCPITTPPRASGQTSCFCLPTIPKSQFLNLTQRSGVQAFQSSTAFGGDRLRAIDNNVDGYWDHNSVTHTDMGVVQQTVPNTPADHQWWTVDLGAIRTIDHVVIYNRQDCCADRLGSFTIYANNPGGGGFYPIGGANMNSNRRIEIDVTMNHTRTIRTQTIWIQKNDNNFLSLAEVQVWGTLI